ncbi:MAG: L,D-transpeptidase [Coriobacteriia bacterium]|nr:L,D-transpeptidase [Coriobacteriia bacterium]
MERTTHTPRNQSAARREQARRARLRARRQRAVLIATLLLIAVVASAWTLAPRAPAAPVSLKELGASAVSRPAKATPPPAAAVERFAAYAVELAKPKEPPTPPLIPAPGIKTILVDKSDQMVTLYEADGTPVDRFQCASGELYPRVGTYKVTSRKAQSMSTYDSSRFYHFVIFTKADTGGLGNIGFHSIPIDREGNEVGGLGKPISHGCVRLAHEKADFIYTWAPNGTKVVVQK